MGILMSRSPSETRRLVERLRTGDRAALPEFFDHYRERLRRMIDLRMDWRLRPRLDPSDVLQEAYLDVDKRLADYLRDSKVPPFLWLRMVVGECLINHHRRHLGTQMRDAGCEVSLYRQALPGASSAMLASMLLGRLTSPSEAAQRAERLLRLQQALNSLEPIDREVLALRH